MKAGADGARLTHRVAVLRSTMARTPMGAVESTLAVVSWGWGCLDISFGRDKLLATEVRDPGIDLSETTGQLTFRCKQDVQPGDVVRVTVFQTRREYNVVAVGPHRQDPALSVAWLSAVTPHPLTGADDDQN